MESNWLEKSKEIDISRAINILLKLEEENKLFKLVEVTDLSYVIKIKIRVSSKDHKAMKSESSRSEFIKDYLVKQIFGELSAVILTKPINFQLVICSWLPFSDIKIWEGLIHNSIYDFARRS